MSNSFRSPHARSARLSVELLEDRTTPTFLPRPGGHITINGVNLPAGGLSIAAGDLPPDAFNPFGLVENKYVTGTGPGTEALVRVWMRNGQPGTPILAFDPFPGFTGGINVAVGDVLGDGKQEIIAAVAGHGPPAVKVFDYSGNLISSFYAFNPAFMGGVNIAVGNVLGGIAAGGYPGGVVSSVFKQEIIVGAAAGDAPHVVVTNGYGSILRSFLAFDVGYLGGVTVAAGSLPSQPSADYLTNGGSDTNAYDDIIVGAAVATPHVKAFQVWTGAIVEKLSFYAFDPSIHQGVTVAAGSTDGIRGAEIYVSQISPTFTPKVRVFNGETAQLLAEFSPYPDGYTQVVNMVVAWITPPSRGASFYDPSDNDSVPAGYNFFFEEKDLGLVAGDASYQQEPRYFIGLFGRPAGESGPPP